MPRAVNAPGARLPKGHGLSYHDPVRDVSVSHPVPLNWVVGLARRTWHRAVAGLAPSELDRLRGEAARSERQLKESRGMLDATRARLADTQRALRVATGCLNLAEAELARAKEQRDALQVAVDAYINEGDDEDED